MLLSVSWPGPGDSQNIEIQDQGDPITEQYILLQPGMTDWTVFYCVDLFGIIKANNRNYSYFFV